MTRRDERDERADLQVTFSSRISNCFKTDPNSFCECSSTTRIFHRPGGFTDLMASRNSTERKYMSYTAIELAL